MDWVAYWHDRAGMVAQFLLLKWFTVLLWMRLKIISWKIVLTEDTKLIFLFDNWFFLKRANPGLFFFSFYLFKHVTNFTTDTFGEKCPSSIRCRDSNSWPLEHEPPPITTRPGLPPKKFETFLFLRITSTYFSKYLSWLSLAPCYTLQAIVQLINLRIQFFISCGPGFESQAHHPQFCHDQ